MAESAIRLKAGWRVRVGIAEGPVVAGIVGNQRYQFDLWGDTVNLAARMTKFGDHGTVVMSSDTWQNIKYKFDGTPLGTRDVKGKGEISVMGVSRLES